MCIDEAGFYLLAAAVRSYAPKGQTPILRIPLTHDHLSVISAVTPTGKLYVHLQEQAFKGESIVQFLQALLEQMTGKLLIIWDGLAAHRGEAVKAFLRAGAAQRIHLERLPPYAPDLNPTEGIWQYLKYVEMKNVCCHSLAELRFELRQAITRLRHKGSIIPACFDRIHFGQIL